MASSNLMAFLAMLLVLLPMTAVGASICDEVECGKGTCKEDSQLPFMFTCECQQGWKRTRLDDENDLQFLPCVIPNCTLDYSCMPAPPPLPDIPENQSFFDPCYWIYCGEGTCTKSSTYKHLCQCNTGYSNLLNITVYPCFNECTLGSDCEKLGIRVSNSSSSTPGSNNGNQASSFLPGKFHWMTILMMSMAMALWK